MLALLYLVIVLVLGFQLMQLAMPWLLDISKRQSLAATSIPVSNWMIQLPAAWLIGALVMNWFTFIASDLARSIHTGSYLMLLTGACICILLGWNKKYFHRLTHKVVVFGSSITLLEVSYLLFSVIISSFIAFHTLSVKDGALLVGSSVWSDFGPHIAIIRSFSLGENFPPQYPHFPEGSIRYHFMFQFMVATLEFLGMRLDWAFNLPSIFSLVSVFLLLYVLAVCITGQRWVGILTGVLFIFRSSFAFFTHVRENLANDNLWQAIWEVPLHIGKTEHEVWGLWAQNVYANQRHFAFSIGVLILLLLALLPLLQAMIKAQQAQSNSGLFKGCRTFFWGKDNWWPENWQRAIILGLILGGIGFWNGAVVITALIILAVLSLFCRHRGEFLIIALLALILTLLQQRWFMGAGGPAVKPSWYFGFLAEHKTLAGIAAFYLELLGLFVPLLFVAIFNTPRGYKALILAFITPLILASLISLTIDINANHKFIMLAVMFSNIFIASLIVRFFQSKDNALRVLAAIFTVLFTMTGWVDLLTLYNMNKNNYAISMNDPVSDWVMKNSNPKDVFLTDWASLHAVQFAGRPIYFGWPYYAWSAGYDTYTREQKMHSIYSATNAEILWELVHAEGIRFIVIDDAVRTSQEYKVNEALIAQTLKLAFKDPKDNTIIYRVD